MSWDAIRQIVEQRFETLWKDTPFVFEEQKRKDDHDTFARCVIRFQESENAALGKVVRENGRVYVQVFHPKGKGTGPGLRLAEKARDIFQNETIGKLTFYAGSIEKIKNENRLQYNVSIPFFYQ